MGDGLQNDHGEFPVAETLSQAADSILTHSFAIYKVNDATAEAIGAAWLQARRFFASSHKCRYHKVVDGNLYGYHVPSEAKLLYRAFCGSSLQPWPNSEFQLASEQVADRLHRILVDCCMEIRRKSIDRTEGEEAYPKRLKVSQPLDIPETAKETALCPLDYFLYHGDKPYAISCSEHVDRGMLICVCLTNVPGLEVRDHSAFVCPEVVTHNADLHHDRQASSGLICIMAGHQLQQTLPGVKACVHRVRNDLKQSRLSISYELRVPLILL
jgi:hypothetical protein